MPSRSTVIALLALFAALAGTATAAKLIDGKKIRKGTVASKQIKDRTIVERDISRSTIKALRARLTPVRSADIADGTIALVDLAPSSVDGTRVVDRSLTAGDLVLDTITSAEIATGGVGEAEVADNSVGNAELKGASISRSNLRASVLRSGIVQADFGGVAADSCEQQSVPAGDYGLPTGTFAVLVSAPAALPVGVVVQGRASDGTQLVIDVCNLTGDAVTVGAQQFPFVAFGTS